MPFECSFPKTEIFYSNFYFCSWFDRLNQPEDCSINTTHFCLSNVPIVGLWPLWYIVHFRPYFYKLIAFVFNVNAVCCSAIKNNLSRSMTIIVCHMLHASAPCHYIGFRRFLLSNPSSQLVFWSLDCGYLHDITFAF